MLIEHVLKNKNIPSAQTLQFYVEFSTLITVYLPICF